MVRQLERDLPELLSFFSFPQPLWRKLRTTNIIERRFVEVRRRTRPIACFVNVRAWIESFIPSSSASTWNERTAPSAYLHKRLHVAVHLPIRDYTPCEVYNSAAVGVQSEIPFV